MKVYQVYSHWVNDDGWGISDPHLKGTFDTEEKAIACIKSETGVEPKYKYAYVPHPNGSSTKWHYEEIEIA